MEKFEITKEQLQTIEADGCTYVKQWFPDAFKNELEVGKWYKSLQTESLIFNKKIESGYVTGYGINKFGEWVNDYIMFGNYQEANPEEANPEEVKSALICEAKKRYENGCLINSLYGINIQKALGNSFEYFEDTNRLWSNGTKLFDNGQWATIIETITIQEAEKLLNKKIV